MTYLENGRQQEFRHNKCPLPMLRLKSSITLLRSDSDIHSKPTAAITAKPRIPHLAVAPAAPPVGVLVAPVSLLVALPLSVDEPACGSPCGVDSLAFLAAPSDEKGLEVTAVPFVQLEGGVTASLLKVISAHLTGFSWAEAGLCFSEDSRHKVHRSGLRSSPPVG